MMVLHLYSVTLVNKNIIRSLNSKTRNLKIIGSLPMVALRLDSVTLLNKNIIRNLKMKPQN